MSSTNNRIPGYARNTRSFESKAVPKQPTSKKRPVRLENKFNIAPPSPPSSTNSETYGSESNLNASRLPQLSEKDEEDIKALVERVKGLMQNSAHVKARPENTEDLQPSPTPDICRRVGSLKRQLVTERDEHQEIVTALNNEIDFRLEELNTSRIEHRRSTENLRALSKKKEQEVYDALQVKDKAQAKENNALRVRDVARTEKERVSEQLRISRDEYELVVRESKEKIEAMQNERDVACQERNKAFEELKNSRLGE